MRRLLPALVFAAIPIATLAWWRPWAAGDTVAVFWRPFLSGGTPVTLCLARAMLPPGMLAPGTAPDRLAFLAWPDAATATKVASLLAAGGRPYQLKRDDLVTFEDLRRGPAVLIGAFNDVWTLRVTENLRFEFRNDGNLRWISDRNNPSSQAWKTESPGSREPSRDYAVISRLLTSRSGRPVLTIAGLRAYGTEIAGEFVTNRAFLDGLADRAPAGWHSRNLQVVIETEVIDGHSGPPKIAAVHVW
jgi:hypothetical protein